MPSRLSKPPPQHKQKSSLFAIHLDDEPRRASLDSAPSLVPSTHRSKPASRVAKLFSHERSSSRSRSTSSVATEGVVNAMSRSDVAAQVPPQQHSRPVPTLPPSASLSRMSSTIRPVRSFEARHSEDSSTDGTPSYGASRNSDFSSSVNSNASGLSTVSQQPTQPRDSLSARTKGPSLAAAADRSSSATLEVPKPQRVASVRHSVEIMGRPSVEIPQRESSLTAVSANHASRENGAEAATPPPPANGWDSTIGKAGLGKTGRVINKLVSDNEALKREIQIEQLRAEESKSAARLLEDKMERVVSDYESRLLEANVTKTLLARKERQVESLKAAVELEQQRARTAGERERTWKDEMEKIRVDAKRTVEDSTNHAALMEGRYNAISSHWKDQGDEVKKAMAKMSTDVSDLLEQRRKDDDRIGTLRDLCDQQDGNIRDLQTQKESIAAQFARYKAEQEALFSDIKTKARQREDDQERMLSETREVLNKLKWALNVKANVPGAE